MRISRLRIRNFQCFRGEHVLELGPKVYAIVARKVDDAERSNWLGKSTLLEAMFFCLTGEHRHRTEDEFVSRGEEVCEVEETFDDGTRVLRHRDKKRTTVFFYPAAGGAPSIQDEAEAKILEFVGLSPADSRATYYFEQKQMSRFVTADPAERMKMVSAWFRLEPLERCEARARLLGAELEDASKKIDGHLAALDQREAEITKVWTREKIDAAIPALVTALEQRSGAIGRLENELEKNGAILAGKRRIADYDQVVAEGKKTAGELATKKLPVLQSTWEAAQVSLSTQAAAVEILVRDAHVKGTVAKGQFDGTCPVAGIACPAKDPINAAFEKNRQEARQADDRYRAGLKVLEEVHGIELGARSELQVARRIETRLESLREQAKKLAVEAKAAKEAGPGEDPATIRQRLEKERGDAMEARGDLERLRGWLGELDRMAETRATLGTRRNEIEGRLGTYREAATIFGKRGAQRRVAEGALGQIEEDANSVLRECGVALTVDVRWSREGKGPASACESCGNPFPASTKVKSCERCGNPRGPKLENKLEILLSDKSGAAEDLAGAAVQLAASRWLREERGTTWSTALLDEPFGALDASHRKGFASHLSSMLGGRYGFEQAFCVAHHASVLDALPGRIEITSDGKWSVPKVIA